MRSEDYTVPICQLGGTPDARAPFRDIQADWTVDPRHQDAEAVVPLHADIAICFDVNIEAQRVSAEVPQYIWGQYTY